MSFFKDFNLARLIILVSLVGAGVFGYLAYGRYQRVLDYRERLGLNSDGVFVPAEEGRPETMSWIEKKVRSIQGLGHDYAEKNRQLAGEGLNGEESPMTYIRSQAVKENVSMGSVSINPDTRPQRGYTDHIYTIVPESDGRNNKPTFERTKIANFLFSLENGSSRVKVTALEMRSAGKPDFEQYHNDLWQFNCKLTERVKQE